LSTLMANKIDPSPKMTEKANLIHQSNLKAMH